MLKDDQYFMSKALELAKKGQYGVKANPLVGCVIVKDDKIIASGYHKIYGQAHAEVNAINNAQEDISDATLYVTLEPCFHFGKTPPCVDLIIKKQIARVVIAMEDVNELTRNKSINKLRSVGISVTVGVLRAEAEKLNQHFIVSYQQQKPYVHLKAAMSLDGKIATKSGESKWISNQEARAYGHQLRNQVMAILVGSNTVICDDPLLTSRIEPWSNPIKIIVDSELKIPLDAKLLKSGEVIILTTKNKDLIKYQKLNQLENVEFIQTPGEKVDLNLAFTKLYARGITSILVEGGAKINGLVLEKKLVNELHLIYAPMIIGGQNARGSFDLSSTDRLIDCPKITVTSITNIVDNILIRGKIV